MEACRGEGFIQTQTPGSRDVLVFEEKKSAQTGKSGGIEHFGFRLTEPDGREIEMWYKLPTLVDPPAQSSI